MAKKFSDLLNLTLKDFRAQWKVYAIFAVGFAVLLTLIQLGAATMVGQYSDTMFGNVSPERIEELSQRMEQGDETALNELMNEMGLAEGEDTEANTEQMAGAMQQAFKAALPAIIVFGVLAVIISVIGQLCYYVIAVHKLKKPGEVLKKAIGYLKPFIVLCFWTIIKTYAWVYMLGLALMPVSMPLGGLVTFVGFILGAIYGPRYVSSMIVFMENKKTPKQAVAMSYSITAGYWGKIVGNLILMGLIVALATIVINIAIGILLFMVPPLQEFGNHFISSLIGAIFAIFLVHLTHTIAQNPMKVAKK